MNEDGRNPSLWRFFDGAASVSASMLMAVLANACVFCTGLPPFGHLKELTNRDDGVIIAATLLLFPTTVVLYGVFKMFFAAKEAVERKARERGRQEGIREGISAGHQAGRQAERERLVAALEQQGVQLTPELARILAGDDE